MKKYKYIICCLLLVTLLFGSLPDSSVLQAASVKKLELHAFYPSQTTFDTKAQKYIDALDSVSFAWGRLYGDLSEGVVTELGKNGNTMFYYPDDYIDVLKYAKSKNKTIQLNIFTDSANAAKILPYADQRAKAANAVAELLKSDAGNGEQIYFDGVVMDFEGLQSRDNKGKPILINGKTMDSWYTQFLKELKAELVKINKKMFVAVNPLIYYSGYNYKDIAAVADKMIIMAHDYEPVSKLTKSDIQDYTRSNSINPADSMAPIKKIRLVMEDVKKYVDKANLGKVMLQINFDIAQWRFALPAGTTWNKTSGSAISLEERNTPTYAMLYDRIQNITVKSKNMTYGYNNELQTPFIQFVNVDDNTQNVVLYENSKSIKAKLDLVKEYGLGGISLWSLGNVPDYTDKVSKTYGLDVWSSILGSLQVGPAAPLGSKVTFSDKTVETAVRGQLMKPTGSIYTSELNRVYRLSVPAGVKTLIDLKKLPNLECLVISNAKITNISYVSSLKNLRSLYLQRNNISDITPLKGLTKLEVLSLNGNRISKISALSSLTQLTELYISDNLIADYTPIAGLKQLNSLFLKGNKSVNYSKLANVKKGLIESDF